MMKFNWGTGIFIFFVIFVGTLVFVLYQSRQVDNSLVIDNYYEEDLNYQAHYEKKQNTEDLPQKVSVEYDEAGKKLILGFPSDSISNITGNVILYDPISKNADLKFPMDIGNSDSFDFSIKDLRSGRWIIKIDWKLGKKLFYQEQEFIL
jgi:hypothetical protein